MVNKFLNPKGVAMKKIILIFLLLPIHAASFYAQSESEVVAVVNGRKITQKEVDYFITGQILPLQEQISILRQSALENLITNLILAEEAKKSGMSVENFRKSLTKVTIDIPASEIEKAYLENSSAFAQMNPDEAKERLRIDLETQARMRLYRKAVDELKSKAKINFLFTYGLDGKEEVNTDGPRLGSNRAKVTIILFSDFQCAFCRQSFPVIKQIIKEYGSSALLIYKHLPLDIHSKAFPAAQASVCANEQGKFWEYHDRLFTSNDFSIKGLNSNAQELGLDISKFNSCLNSEQSRSEIIKDMREAKRLKIDGTPTFFVNGKRVKGYVDFEGFRQIIEEALKKVR